MSTEQWQLSLLSPPKKAFPYPFPNCIQDMIWLRARLDELRSLISLAIVCCVGVGVSRVERNGEEEGSDGCHEWPIQS